MNAHRKTFMVAAPFDNKCLLPVNYLTSRLWLSKNHKNHTSFILKYFTAYSSIWKVVACL